MGLKERMGERQKERATHMERENERESERERVYRNKSCTYGSPSRNLRTMPVVQNSMEPCFLG